MTPDAGQLALLVVAIALLVIGGVISLLRMRFDHDSMRVAAKACQWGGIIATAAVLIWHSALGTSWLPLEDNFDALIWLGVLLAGFVMYVQRRRPIGGLDWFVMPIVVLLLISAAIFGRERPHEYVSNTWSWVHRVTAYGGTIGLFVAGAVGVMYLVANHRLRSKVLASGPRFGSLERLEHVTMVSVTLGFALLTVGLITGLMIILQRGGNTLLGRDWMTSPKVLLTCVVWLVYAIVLHSPMNPTLRGRRTAMLSILGFVLTLSTLVAVQFMPGAR